MPKYFIDMRNKQGLAKDERGVRYKYLEDAIEDAKASSRVSLHEYIDDQPPLTEICIKIRDVQGRTVVALTLGEILQDRVHSMFKNDLAELTKREDSAGRERP
jgi:hypothetical protein